MVVAPLLLQAALLGLASSWYATDLSGIPDEGPVPTRLLPWFLHAYGLNGDSMRIATWLAACGAYFLPAILVLASVRGRREALLALVVVLGVAVSACVLVPSPPTPSSRAYFNLKAVQQARLWIAALTAAGALVGGAIALVRLSRPPVANQSPRAVRDTDPQ